MRSIRARTELAVVLAGLLASGCREELPGPIGAAHGGDPAATPTRGGVLELASFADVRALDPANLSDGLAPQMLEAMFAGLVDYDAEGRIVPDLAERWSMEDEGKTFRFVLKEGVRFHDGEEVTAEDVKRSVERALHPSAPNPFASYFESIAGIADFAAKNKVFLHGFPNAVPWGGHWNATGHAYAASLVARHFCDRAAASRAAP